MTPALKWAAIRAILMFHNCEGQSHKVVSLDHNFRRKRRAEADSNWGPSAFQPNALPLGQTGWQLLPPNVGGVYIATLSRRLGPAQDFPLWKGLFTGLGRPGIPVTVNCMSPCVYGVNGDVCWHVCECGFYQVVFTAQCERIALRKNYLSLLSLLWGARTKERKL